MGSNTQFSYEPQVQFSFIIGCYMEKFEMRNIIKQIEYKHEQNKSNLHCRT